MQYILEFLGLMAVFSIFDVVPGADFAVILRQSIVHGRRAAMMTGLGMGFSHLRHPMNNLPYKIVHVDGSTSERNKANMPFAPFDMPAAHIFKIGADGLVHEIEAAGIVVRPNNQPTGWE